MMVNLSQQVTEKSPGLRRRLTCSSTYPLPINSSLQPSSLDRKRIVPCRSCTVPARQRVADANSRPTLRGYSQSHELTVFYQPRPSKPLRSAQQTVWTSILSSLLSVHCRFGPVPIDFRCWNVNEWKTLLTLDLGTREEVSTGGDAGEHVRFPSYAVRSSSKGCSLAVVAPGSAASTSI